MSLTALTLRCATYYFALWENGTSFTTEQNGYMEDIGVLLRAPFDKPTSFVRLFATGQQKKLVDTINQIKRNAEVVA